MSEHARHLAEQRELWDAEAATFDDEPDHGLRDPLTRETWAQLLAAHLPPPPADVLDLGCGTGSLTLLLADAGHAVRGLDLSPAMVDRARAKVLAAGLDVPFEVGDAGEPPFEAGSADAVVCRHVLWALPDQVEVLRRWRRLLRPAGRLVLVEGRWHTGGGLTAADSEALVAEAIPDAADVRVLPLPDESFWGGPIDDERYALVVRR